MAASCKKSNFNSRQIVKSDYFHWICKLTLTYFYSTLQLIFVGEALQCGASEKGALFKPAESTQNHCSLLQKRCHDIVHNDYTNLSLSFFYENTRQHLA
jgi:hypothetical protein